MDDQCSPSGGTTMRIWTRGGAPRDRKSTRPNSSHGYISYAVFCLKKKNHPGHQPPWDFPRPVPLAPFPHAVHSPFPDPPDVPLHDYAAEHTSTDSSPAPKLTA